MRIFHGVREIAGQGINSVMGLRENGFHARMVTFDKNPSAGLNPDLCLNIDKRKKYLFPWYLLETMGLLIYALAQFDVFHFHFGYSLLPNNMDLPLLKLFKKTIIAEFHGSELRIPELAYNAEYYVPNIVYSKKKRKSIEKLCRYAEHVILHDDELITHLPKTKAQINIVPLRIDISRLVQNTKSQSDQTIQIAHAPTSRGGKGTEYVYDAIRKLKKRYDVELVVVENMPWEEAIACYGAADIIVDQLVTGTYGVFAIEAMALGKPVITYIVDDMKKALPVELPIQSASKDDIEQVLEKLIRDHRLRVELGTLGRQYAAKYHDYKKVTKILPAIYRGETEPATGRRAFARIAELQAD